MAQLKTRWFSGKITTSSSVENKQNANIEEPQISKTQFLKPSNNNSTHSKISLKRPTASGSFMQAGKRPDAEIQPPHPDSDSTTSSNLKHEINYQLVQRNDIPNKQITQQTEQFLSKTNDVEFNLSLKGVTAYNKQQANKPSTAVASIDFNYWFPYVFVQTLRRKLQESANQLTAKKVLELQYFENEMTSITDKTTTETCIGSYYQNYSKPQKPHAISYKCPRKKPKFKATYFENKNNNNEDTQNLRNCKSNATSITISPSVKSINSEHAVNLSTCSASSNEQNIDRNISPASVTKSFKWLSDAELNLNLASVSPSSISTTESMSWSTSGLQTLLTEEFTPYEIPAMPRDHDLYLAAIEQLKNSIKDSRKQRSRADKESSFNNRTSSEKKINFQSNDKVGISQSSKRNNGDEFATTTDTSSRLKQRWKPDYEKTNKQNKVLVKKETISCAKTASKLSTVNSRLSQIISNHSEKDLLKKRLKRFIEESKSVTTSLDVVAASTSSKSRNLIRMDNLKFSNQKSDTSKSSSSNESNQIRLRRFIAESKAGNSTLDTENQPTASSEFPSANKSTQQTTSRACNSIKLSAHDREQLAAIDQLKQRLRKSIKDFKKRMATSTTTNIVKNTKNSDKPRDSSYVCHDYQNEPKLKPKRPIKPQTPNHKQKLSSPDPVVKAFEAKTSKKVKDCEQTTKLRKLVPYNKQDQVKHHMEHPIKESRKQGKAMPAEDHLTKTAKLKNQCAVKTLKQSKAQTSLHTKNVGKENSLPTETGNLKQCRKHEKTRTNCHVNKPTQPESGRSRKVQTKAPTTEKYAKPKRADQTSTKGTQCESTTDVFDDTLNELENFSTEMELKTLLNPHTTRSEALSAVLKFRYKSLIERARGEFAWLQLKKQRYKSKGLHEHIAAVRKKQQQLLKKMESERSMIQQLESALSTPYLQTDIMDAQMRQRAGLTPTKSAPDFGTDANDSKPTLSQRLQRVEYMLAWNFKLDQKEADVTELEHMLLDCNKNLNIAPGTNIKSLLYRITNVESRLSKINEKLESLESSAAMAASSQTKNADQQPCSNSKLNQFWQRLTTQKCEKPIPKQCTNDTTLKQYCKVVAEAATDGFNDLRKFNTPSPSSSSQYLVFDPAKYLQQDDAITTDDGIVVLYSPRVPSLHFNISSCQSVLNNENVSTTSSIANSTFSISKRYTKPSSTSDRKSK